MTLRQVSKPRSAGLLALVALFCLTGLSLHGQASEAGIGIRRRPVRPDPVRLWLRANGIRLDTVEGAGPTTDLLPLSPWIGSADIIALGDGTHGTREYYTVKQRIIQFMAEAGIARTVILEAPWPELLRINEYIHGGEGDARTLMRTEWFFFWEYEEMVELVEWAREFNASRGADQQIELLGFDVLTADVRDAADLVIAFLEQVDPAAGLAAVSSYQCVPEVPPGSIATSSCSESVAGVREGIESNAASYTLASSLRALQRALHSARVVEQTSEYFATDPAERDLRRDERLAQNVTWFSDEWTGNERLIVWAHNEHIGTLPAVGQWKSMGQHLDESHGERYFAIGTCMLEGAMTSMYRGQLTAVAMQSPLSTNYELQLAKAGYDALVVPLFHPDTPAWLTEPANLRFGTAGYDPANAEYHNPAYSLPAKFDAIIFVKETTPTTVIVP